MGLALDDHACVAIPLLTFAEVGDAWFARDSHASHKGIVVDAHAAYAEGSSHGMKEKDQTWDAVVAKADLREGKG